MDLDGDVPRFSRRITVVRSFPREHRSGDVDQAIGLLTPFRGVLDGDASSNSRVFSMFSYLTLGPHIVETVVHRQQTSERNTSTTAGNAHQRSETISGTERLSVPRDGLERTPNGRRPRRTLTLSDRRRPVNGTDPVTRSDRPRGEANRAVSEHSRHRVEDSRSAVGSDSDDSLKRPEETDREMSTTLTETPLTVRSLLAHQGVGSPPVDRGDPRVLATAPSIHRVGSERQGALPSDVQGDSEQSSRPEGEGAQTETSTTLPTNGARSIQNGTVDGNVSSDHPSESFYRPTGGEQPLAPEAETGPRLTVRKTPSSLEDERTEQENVNQFQSELDGDFDRDFSSPMTSSHSRPIEPQIDVDHLTDQMYDKIQQKMRIERERRGF